MEKSCFYLRKGLILLVRCYQLFISPFIGNVCRFEPTCSNYYMIAINRWGTVYATTLIIKRLLRCHPFHSAGYDPVPEKPNTNP